MNYHNRNINLLTILTPTQISLMKQPTSYDHTIEFTFLLVHWIFFQ